MKIIYKVLRRLRVALFPTERDREYARWLADGGDEKLRFDYDLGSKSLVIDLGGYKGQWAADIYARYNSRVLIFEPVRAFADEIKKRFEHNPNIVTYYLALGASRRHETIGLSENESSIYGVASKKETIEVEDVVDFFAAHDIACVGLIKINIEGGEYELLERIIDSGLISKIENVQVQFHDFVSDAEIRRVKILEKLKNTHVSVYQYKFIWESWAHRSG